MQLAYLNTTYILHKLMHVHTFSKANLFDLLIPSTSKYLCSRNLRLNMACETKDETSCSKIEQLIKYALTQKGIEMYEYFNEILA